jgi:hypothetical protein
MEESHTTAIIFNYYAFNAMEGRQPKRYGGWVPSQMQRWTIPRLR